MTIFLSILLSLLTLGFIVYPLVRPRGPAVAVRVWLFLNQILEFLLAMTE